jgi:biopolymer transport protein ExbB/TolQ
MNFLYLILGGAGLVLVTVLFPRARSFFLDRKTKQALEDNQKTNKQLDKDLDVVDNKIDKVNIDEAKIDQKLEDLKDKEVSNSDIVNFIDLMEKQANEKK